MILSLQGKNDASVLQRRLGGSGDGGAVFEIHSKG